MATVQNVAVLFLVFAAAIGVSNAKIYKVGDSQGWTTRDVNYGAWVHGKTFYVGDALVFQYDNEFIDVLEVTRENYDSCNTTSPIARHRSGNDYIYISRKGHYYFVCSFPYHCDFGQKVYIRVEDNPSPLPATSSSMPPASSPPSPTPGPSPSMTPAPSPPSPSPAPSPSMPPASSHATSTGLSFVGCAIFAVAKALFL